MEIIQSKPTVYKDVQFRSLLEAQWAAFFDALGIRWEYEPEKIKLSNGAVYIPDFWFPHTIEGLADEGWGMWVEMKPIFREDNDYQVSKLLQVCQITKHNALLFVGYPRPGEYEVIKYSVRNEPDHPDYGTIYHVATGLVFHETEWGFCGLNNANGFNSYPDALVGSLNAAYHAAQDIKAGEVNA